MKIHLGHRTLQVWEVEHQDLCDGPDSDVWGEFWEASGGIALSNKLPTAKERAATLVHELCHAIYANAALAPGDDEERVVTVLSNGFCELIVRNPWLLDLLKEELVDGRS